MKEHHSSPIRFIVAVISLTAYVTALSTGASAQQRLHNAAVRRPLIELRSIDQLKAAFQRDSGKVRVVVLVSPT